MPELRQNLATKEWVIVSTERAKRPEQFKTEKVKKELPSYDQTCPFCPGNENRTPYETFVLKRNEEWKVRVVPNKFAALSSGGHLERKIEGLTRWMSGVGIHEVVIESPLHNLSIATLSQGDVADVISVYRNRYLAASNDPRVRLVTIFRNHGESAGTSLEHPHSQLIATPVVPSHIRYRIEEAMRYYDEHGECVFCSMLRDELKVKERIVLETASFVSFIPYASLSPFHTWILPKRHMASFAEINDIEVEDLALSLKTTLAKFFYGLSNPDYNYVIRSVPIQERECEYYHWYISIVPRLIRTAGFELGSGMFINTSLPEENAKFLREIKLD